MTAKVKAIWNLYKHGRITKAQLRAKVTAVLSEEEYTEITGEAYISESDKAEEIPA